MGFPARSLAVLALVLAPAVAAAQGTGGAAPPPGGPAPTAPPPGGGAPPPPGGTSSGGTNKNLEAPADPGDKAPKRDAAGFSFSDKPVRRGPKARIVHKAGPQATFPGFEQLPDGGSRLFVQLSQSVAVEERRAPGAITYVLKGAHARVHNDTNELVTVHFNTPVAGARLVPQGNDVLFVVRLRAASTPTFKVQDNQDKTSTLMIDFPKGDFGGGDAVAADAPEAPKVGTHVNKTSARKAGAPRRTPSSPGAPPPAPPPAAPAAPPPAPAGPTP